MDILDRFFKEVKTVPQMFYNTVENFGDRPALKYKIDGDYHIVDYKNFASIVSKMANGLLDLGLQKGDKVCLMAPTSAQWAWADFAILSAGGVTVTVYHTLSSEDVAYIVNHSEARFIFAGNEDIKNIILEARVKTSILEKVIVLDSTYLGVEKDVITIHELKEQGQHYIAENPLAYTKTWQSLQGSDPFSIIYTSGTTGQLKGVLLTHEDMIGALWRSLKHMSIGGYDADYNEVAFSILPLAHIWERNNSYMSTISVGGCIVYGEKPSSLLQDMQANKPSWVLLVPRIWSRIYNGFKALATFTPEQKERFEWAQKIGEKVLTHRTKANGTIDLTVDPTDGLDENLKADFLKADQEVYSILRNMLGGNLKVAYSGGAHLPADLQKNFLTMNFPIMNGWGLTETAAGINHGFLNAVKIGWLSKMVPGVDVRLEDDGELLVKGVGVIREYYKDSEETSQSFTEDGWFMTGDIGEFDEEGFLRLVDRKKAIIVMDTGKNVAPAKIESKFVNSPIIDQVMILGDDSKYISALVVPTFDVVTFLIKQKGYSIDETKLKFANINGLNMCVEVGMDVVDNPLLNELVNDEIKRINQYLENHETIKSFKILHRRFSEELGELTPTLKVKKKVVVEHFANEIKDLYK